MTPLRFRCTWLPTCAAAVLLAVGALCSASAQAQIWNETNDAGSLISTAQTTVGTGTLFSIRGTLASPTDVDVFCIRMPSVPPQSLPFVQLQCVVQNGPNVYLFNSAGQGVQTNVTCSGGYKTLVAPGTLTAGFYYVAVSYSGYDPQSAGGAIWLTGPSGPRAPDGPGAAGALSGWAGTPNVQPSNPYQLDFQAMTFCDAAVGVVRPTWGALRLSYR